MRTQHVHSIPVSTTSMLRVRTRARTLCPAAGYRAREGVRLVDSLLGRPLLAHVAPRAVLEGEPPRAREEAKGRLQVSEVSEVTNSLTH